MAQTLQRKPYDHIIVGGGSAGCVAAWRLVQEMGRRVLMIERGPARPPGLARFLLPMPAGWIKCLNHGAVVEMHQPVPQKHLNGRQPAVGQAAVLGGGTAVNAMVYTRGQHADYDNWDAFLGANSGWAFKDMLPHFCKIENNHDFPDQWHGTAGPMHVSGPGSICRTTEFYVRAVRDMGVPLNLDFNGASQSGVGTMQYTTNQKRRCSGVDAFLEPLAANDNFTLLTDTTVSRLVIEKGRCIGVAYVKNGREETETCETDVLLAAGSYNTPKIMLLSGLGPGAQMAPHGIKTIVDLKGVGENLQDHHEVPVVAAMTGHHGYYGEDQGLRALWNGLRYLMFRDGPVSSTGVEACAYVDPDGGDRPSIKMYCIPAVYLDREVKGVKPRDGVTLNACLLRPKSRGHVRLRSNSPYDKPLIDNNYLSEPDDLRLEILGLRYAREILKRNPLAGHVTDELLPGKSMVSDADLAEHCRRTVKTNWHPVGTCRMGSDRDEDAVLDPQLRVRGVSNLRIIDASAMPFIPSGNTNAPTMALASRAMEFLR
jgi:choline dehydrogenase